LTLKSMRHQPNSTTENLPATRFGISVSQKVSKKAVARNLLKRQIKTVLRLLLPQIANGWSVVIGVRPSAQGCEYVEILRELEQLLKAAEVLDGY
jgi:ribonuclease P protein component